MLEQVTVDPGKMSAKRRARPRGENVDDGWIGCAIPLEARRD